MRQRLPDNDSLEQRYTQGLTRATVVAVRFCRALEECWRFASTRTSHVTGGTWKSIRSNYTIPYYSTHSKHLT